MTREVTSLADLVAQVQALPVAEGQIGRAHV